MWFVQQAVLEAHSYFTRAHEALQNFAIDNIIAAEEMGHDLLVPGPEPKSNDALKA